MPPAEIVERLAASCRSSRSSPAYPGEVAQPLPLRRTAAGEIGVIASVTQPFCRDCTRARLSAEGKLFTCLFATPGPRPARAAARRLQRRGARRRASALIWGERTDRYSELRASQPAEAAQAPRRASRCPTSAADVIARDDITGLVLAGGRGARMGGVDKGLQAHHGMPLALHALLRLAPQVGQTMINANRNLGAYESMGVPVWPDTIPDYAGRSPVSSPASNAARRPTW